MISSPPTIQTQLGEAISLIADSDFWERWDTLTKVRINGVPATTHQNHTTNPAIIRILSAVSPIPTSRSRTACWKLHIRSSCDGGHFSSPMISTGRFYTLSAILASPLYSC